MHNLNCLTDHAQQTEVCRRLFHPSSFALVYAISGRVDVSRTGLQVSWTGRADAVGRTRIGAGRRKPEHQADRAGAGAGVDVAAAEVGREPELRMSLTINTNYYD